MMSSIFKISFHLAVVINYALFLRHHWAVDEALNKAYPGREDFGGKWKYLTHLNVALQLAVFSLALCNDLLEMKAASGRKKAASSSSSLRRLYDFLLTTAAFPIGVFVTVSFWSIWAVDRELVFPRELDAYFPPVTNHMMHTVPAFSLLAELYTSCHVFPASKLAGMAVTGVYIATYLAIAVSVHHYTGHWVYGFLEVLSFQQRNLFFAMCTGVIMLFYLMGQALDNLFWHRRHEQATTNGKTKMK